MNRVFLLSPAHARGRRAAMLLRPQATFELARQVQTGGASLGAVFTFCSGLYFRGKLTYARQFGHTADLSPAVHVITPSRGLVAAETLVSAPDLHEFASVPVDSKEPRFTEPLIRTATILTARGNTEFVLLGSIATGKYLDTLLPIFGPKLLFPADFPSRGDMSRGALLLRAAAANQELVYLPVIGATLSRQIKRRDSKSAPRAASKIVF